MRQEILGVFGEITTMPGCSQVAISHGVFVPKDLRGRGLGTQANELRVDRCRDLGYDAIICTVCLTNEAQMKVMKANGWREAGNFLSSRTGSVVCLFFKPTKDQ